MSLATFFKSLWNDEQPAAQPVREAAAVQGASDEKAWRKLSADSASGNDRDLAPMAQDRMQKLAESLDSQFDEMRMQAGMPPPPPPAESDAGFTEEELTDQLAEIGSTDSARASLISNVVNNFDAADTNEDGKVSFQEAIAYDKANPTSSSSAATDSTSSTDSTTSATSVASSDKTDAQVFRQLMELLRTYGESDDSTKNLLSTLVTTA